MRFLHYLISCLMATLMPVAHADLVLVAEPIDHPVGTAARPRFYRRLANKILAGINAYWARPVFPGKTRPPQVAESVEVMLRQVATYPGALAYVERSRADARVKIVFELGE